MINPSALGVEEASERMLAALPTMQAERVALDRAVYRVLASDVVSALTLPPWASAAMDGYAVRSEDVKGASPSRPVRLRVVGSVAAGAFPARAVSAGEAVRIMTGAPVPEGADSVVRVEDTDRGERDVEIRDGRDAGRNVRARGEDVAAGTVVAQTGMVISPTKVAILAAVGLAYVDVRSRPQVGILSTGDELVSVHDAGAAYGGRRIVSSNGPALAAMVRAAGGDVIDLGISSDDPEEIRDRLDSATTADLIVTSGGVSVGAHDHLRDVVADLGAVDFWRVRMRPGSQLAFGRIGSKPWIGVPGNPVSAVVVGELFVRPAVLRMMGVSAVHRIRVGVTVGERIEVAPGATHLLRVQRDRSTDPPTARLSGGQSSNVVSALARADALLVVPEGTTRLEPGDRAWAIPLGEGTAERPPIRADG